MSVKVLKTDGTETSHDAEFEGEPPLEWLQQQVGGYIEMVWLSEESVMYVNEEGKLNGLPVNLAATGLFYRAHGSRDLIFGNAVVLDGVHDSGYARLLVDV